MIDVRRYGRRALLVTPRVDVPRGHPDVVDVVPGAETVLVVVRSADAVGSVRDWVVGLEAEAPVESDQGSGSEVVIDVVYDGDDLVDVAAASGLSVAEVVALHSGGAYRCDFCGFAPGFGYLSGLEPRLVLPRLSTPRTSVPVGSVAIAGPYTAVYPSASPGGWHLLGHTSEVLWDLSRDPPALITPGTTVRFRSIEHSGRPGHQKLRCEPPRTRAGVLRVVAAGVATSLQDRGRSGYAHLAVPTAGALDQRLTDLVNRLVGNPPGAAVLETAGGLALEAVAPAVVADSTSGAVQTLTVGERVHVDPAHGEAWAYVAVRGGFDVEPVLGSRSWDSLSKLGPEPSQPGDLLAVGEDPGTPVATDQAPHRLPEPTTVVRLHEGPRADWFAPNAFMTLTSTEWTVATTSRVGARLSGPRIERSRTGELPSEGLVSGAVQVPPDGQPVVMLADHPTTGGYPVLAVVDDRDLARLAQSPPGTPIRFRPAAVGARR